MNIYLHAAVKQLENNLFHPMRREKKTDLCAPAEHRKSVAKFIRVLLWFENDKWSMEWLEVPITTTFQVLCRTQRIEECAGIRAAGAKEFFNTSLILRSPGQRFHYRSLSDTFLCRCRRLDCCCSRHFTNANPIQSHSTVTHLQRWEMNPSPP